MASDVEICNMGLSHIRSGSINALNESSNQAQQCNLFYGKLRDMMLEDYNWGFSNKIKPLALLTETDQVFGWAYSYRYPSDCLHLNSLVLPTDALTYGQGARADQRLRDIKINYKVFNVNGGKVIVSNEPNLRINYRAAVTDPNLFTFKFILSLSHLLASYIAISVVGEKIGAKFKSDNLAMYNAMVESAAADSMNEEYESPRDSDYVTAMFS